MILDAFNFPASVLKPVSTFYLASSHLVGLKHFKLFLIYLRLVPSTAR